MKKLFLIIIIILFSNIVNAQNTIIIKEGMPFDTIIKLVTYKEVVKQKGTADEFYLRAISWIGATYENAEAVTSKRDRDNGIIEGKTRFKLYTIDKSGNKFEAGNISYKILLECKEGRYRFTFNNFNHDMMSRFPAEKWLNKKDIAYNPNWDSYLKQIDDYMKALIVKLNKSMRPEVKIDDTW